MNFEFLHTMIRLLFNKLVVRWKKSRIYPKRKIRKDVKSKRKH